MREKQFQKIGNVKLPEAMVNYVETHGDRIQIEQSAFDAMNGYVLDTGTRITIEHLCEYCTICGWHSMKNPYQKKLPAERNHRIERRYEPIFKWDNYSPNREDLEESFKNAINTGGIPA